MDETREGYVMKLPVAEVILGSFVFLTLPMLILAWLQGFQGNLILNYFYVCFGMSHFFVTFAVYCNSVNLKYFFSDWKNVCLYVVIPLVIVAGFFGYYQLDLRHEWAPYVPFIGPIVLLFVRALDFLHVGTWF